MKNNNGTHRRNRIAIAISAVVVLAGGTAALACQGGSVERPCGSPTALYTNEGQMPAQLSIDGNVIGIVGAGESKNAPAPAGGTAKWIWDNSGDGVYNDVDAGDDVNTNPVPDVVECPTTTVAATTTTDATTTTVAATTTTAAPPSDPASTTTVAATTTTAASSETTDATTTTVATSTTAGGYGTT